MGQVRFDGKRRRFNQIDRVRFRRLTENRHLRAVQHRSECAYSRH
jgi:hypothetical protein